MSAIRCWKLVAAAAAAAVVIAGGAGMTVLQLRAGDTNEPGPPNIDTRTWVTERIDEGFTLRRPADWPSKPFSYSVGHAGSGGGTIISNHAYDFGAENESPAFRRLPPSLAAFQIRWTTGPPNLETPPQSLPNTAFPLALEQSEPDKGASSSSGVMLRHSLVVHGKGGGDLAVWIGRSVSPLDAEIARRLVSSFGFEEVAASCAEPRCAPRFLTPREKRRTEGIALRDKRVVAKLTNKRSRVVEFAFSPGPGDRVPGAAPCRTLGECIEVRIVNYTDSSWFAVRVRGESAVDVRDQPGKGPGLSLEEQMIAHEIAESYRGARAALKGRPHTHSFFAHDQGGPAPCEVHRCGFVFFQIARGLKFRVTVDLNEQRAIAFS